VVIAVVAPPITGKSARCHAYGRDSRSLRGIGDLISYQNDRKGRAFITDKIERS
jgi:hypothetical protein